MKKEKGKGLMKEFKEFVAKGNAMSLAVGVIIGGAFQAIVNSLVNDIIMPIVSLFTGGLDFADKLFIPLDGNFGAYPTLAAAQEAGVATLSFGSFISAVINFFIMAIVIFLLVKAVNSVGNGLKKAVKEEEKPEEPAKAPRVCPYCKSEVADDATRCPHCTSMLDAPEAGK